MGRHSMRAAPPVLEPPPVRHIARNEKLGVEYLDSIRKVVIPKRYESGVRENMHANPRRNQDLR